MSEQQFTNPEARTRSRGNDSLYLLIVAAPILLLVAVISAASASWWNNHRRYNGVVANPDASETIDPDVEIALGYDRGTSTKHTAKWKRILDASAQAMGSQHMIVFNKTNPDKEKLHPKGSDWVLAAPVKRVVNETDAIVAELDDLLTQLEDPIWLPIHFRGYSTLLIEVQQMHSLAQLLGHHLQDAFHNGDPERALKIIRRFEVFTNKDAPEFEAIISQLARFQHLSRRDRFIRDTLAYEFWDQDQLREIDSILGSPLDLDEQWKRGLSAEAMWGRTVLENPKSAVDGPQINPAMISVAPSVRIEFLERLSEMGELSEVGTMRHVRRVQAVQDGLTHQDGSWAGHFSFDRLLQLPIMSDTLTLDLMTPSVSNYAASFANRVAENHFTRTAIAVKRYKLQTGKLPTRLSQLSEIGFPNEMTLERDSHPLHFEHVAARIHRGLVFAMPLSGNATESEIAAHAKAGVDDDSQVSEPAADIFAIRLIRQHDPTLDKRLPFSELHDEMVTIIQ